MAFGRFSRSPVAQPMSDINVTPLVDVMLVLVVIFILAAPLLAGSLRLELPRAQGATPGAAVPSLHIEMARSGALALNGAPVDEAQLPERLRAIARASPNLEMALRADAAVPYGRVVQLMGWAHAAGLTRIAFMTEPVVPAPKAGDR